MKKILALAIPLALAAGPFAFAQGDVLDEEDPLRRQIDRLSFYLETGDVAEREHAIQGLIELGPSAVPYLESRMAGRDEEIAAHYLRVLAAIQKPEFEDPAAPGPRDEATSLLESYFRGRYEQARELYRQGKFDRASELVDAILVLEPSLPFREEILALRDELRRRHLLVGALAPHARANRQFVPWGEKVVLDVFLHNVGTTDFAFAARWTDAEGVVQSSTIRVVADMVQHDLSGTTHTNRLQLSTPLASDVRIAPDQRWAGTVEFNPLSEVKPGFVVARITIRATIQVVQVLEGTPVPPAGIPFLPVTVTVLSPDYVKVARDPFASYLEAIAAEKKRETFLASFLIPRGHVKRSIDETMARLSTASPEMRECLYSILARWTANRTVPRSSEAWRQWWAARRETWVPPYEE